MVLADLRTPREEHLCLTGFDPLCEDNFIPQFLAEKRLQILELTVSICRACSPTQLVTLWNPTGPEKDSGEGLLSVSNANAENYGSLAGVPGLSTDISKLSSSW